MPAKKKTKRITSSAGKTKKPKDNTLFYTALIIFSILLAMLIYRKMFTPPVEIVMACSDYCPGPTEQYEVSAYKGVTNKVQCMLIGGKMAAVSGWNAKNVCIAQ